MDWTEPDGPPVPPPAHRGVGTQLLVEGLGHEFGAHATLDFGSGGLCCALAIPLPEAAS